LWNDSTSLKKGFRSLKTPPNGLISQSTCKNSNSSASASGAL